MLKHKADFIFNKKKPIHQSNNVNDKQLLDKNEDELTKKINTSLKDDQISKSLKQNCTKTTKYDSINLFLSHFLNFDKSASMTKQQYKHICKTMIKYEKLEYFQRQYQNYQFQAQQSMPCLQNQKTLNSSIQKLSFGQTILSDQKFTIFSQILQKDQTIKNYLNGPPSVGLTLSQVWDQKYLRQNVSSIALEGGGYIIVGVDQQEKDKIKGVLRNKFNFKELDYLLRKIERQIFPKISLTYGYIPLVTDLYADNSFNQNHQQIIVKINVNIQNKGYLHFIYLKNKGYHDIFQIYHLSSANKNNKLASNSYNSLSLMRSQQIYPFMLKNYKNHVFKQNSIKYLSNQLSHQYDISQEMQNKQVDCDEKMALNKYMKISQNFKSIRQKQEPNFAFKENSLIIVGSEKKNAFIEMFRNSLVKQNKKFILKRPFQKFIQKGGRVIWFFSYQDKSDIMRQFIKKCDKGKNFTFIPITATLRILTNKMDKVEFEKVMSEYNKIYPHDNVKMQKGLYQGKDHKIVDCLYLYFTNYKTSVLGFCLLQKNNIKPFCVTQQDIIKQKVQQCHKYYKLSQ